MTNRVFDKERRREEICPCVMLCWRKKSSCMSNRWDNFMVSRVINLSSNIHSGPSLALKVLITASGGGEEGGTKVLEIALRAWDQRGNLGDSHCNKDRRITSLMHVPRFSLQCEVYKRSLFLHESSRFSFLTLWFWLACKTLNWSPWDQCIILIFRYLETFRLYNWTCYIIQLYNSIFWYDYVLYRMSTSILSMKAIKINKTLYIIITRFKLCINISIYKEL